MSITNGPERRGAASKPKNMRVERFRLLIKSFLKNKFPYAEDFFRRLYRNSQKFWLVARWQLNLLSNYLSGNRLRCIYSDKLYWVNPKVVEFSSLREFSLNDKGRVISGDWDLLQKRFEDLDIYMAIKQVCKENGQWQDTVFYKRLLSRIQDGDIPYSCRSQEDLDQKCHRIEKLYSSIRERGYKTQSELASDSNNSASSFSDDEILLNIGRYGDLLFSNSAHRLAISRLIGLEKVPVKIVVRHVEWINFVNELCLYAKSTDGKLPQPVKHPDLMSIPVVKECEIIFEMIRRAMKSRQGRLFDVGACLGYYADRFEEVGFACDAVEFRKEEKYFLKKLKRAQGMAFNLIEDSVMKSASSSHVYYDSVLVLDMAQQFQDRGEYFHKSIMLLQQIDIGELFIALFPEGQHQIVVEDGNNSPDTLVGYLRQILGFNCYESMGVISGGQALYRFYR